MTERIGVLGGTFDPPHTGHMRMAEKGAGMLDLDKVIFVPANIPPHKESFRVSSSYHRYAMTVLSALNYENFTVSTFELEREEVSYTYHTLKAFKEREPEGDFFFLMGADSLIQIDTWKKPLEIMKYSNLVVFNRPGFEIKREDIPEALRGRITELPLKKGRNIYIVEMEPVDVSSTDLREAFGENGESAKYLPKNVSEYIDRMGLYSDNKGNNK